MHIALTIAGSDPTGGAGLQADLQVFRAHGVHGAGAVTALTVQDTSKVKQVLPAFPSVVLDQLRTLLADLPPDAVKIGALASDDVARMVSLALDALPAQVPIVIDPVLHASCGSELLEPRALGTLTGLIARAALVTPNLGEAETLTGEDTGSRAGCEAAGRFLVEQTGAGAALVKGGHRDGPPDDLLVTRESGEVRVEWLAGTRIAGGPVHGTGCALSSAVTARLARGEPLPAAIAGARAFVAHAIERAESAGSGARLLRFESA